MENNRKRSLANSSPKAPPNDQLLGQSSQQANGYGDPPAKRSCTSTEVKVQISTPADHHHQTKVVVQTTIESTVDMGNNGAGIENIGDLDGFATSPGGSGGFDDIGKLLEGMDNEKELDDLLATVVGNPSDIAAFEAQLAKVEEDTRKMLNEEFGENLAGVPKGQQQQPQQQQLQQDGNGGNDGNCMLDSQKEPPDIKPKIEPGRDSFDPNMTAPPNTIATKAADNKSGPLPGIKNLIAGTRDNYNLLGGRIKLEKEAAGSNNKPSIPNSCAQNFQQQQQPQQQSMTQSVNPSTMPAISQLASMHSNVSTNLSSSLGRTSTISVSTSVSTTQNRSYPTPVGMSGQNFVMNSQQQQNLSASGTSNTLQQQQQQQQFVGQPSGGRLPGFGTTFQSQVGAGAAHPMHQQQQQQQFKREQTLYSQDNTLVNQQQQPQQNMSMPMQQQQQFTQQPQTQITQQQLISKMQQQLQHQRMKQLTAEQRFVLRRQLQQQIQKGPPPRYNEQHRTFSGASGMVGQQQQATAGNIMNRMMGQAMPGGNPSHQNLQQNMLPMRTNQVQSPMYQNQAQVQQFLQQQRQQQMIQQRQGMQNPISNPQQQAMNAMAMSRGQHPNATMGPGGPFMKQIRNQNSANMWPNQMQNQGHNNSMVNSNAAAPNMSQTIRQQLSNIVRFPGGGRFSTQNVSTAGNMQNYHNISSQANLHAVSRQRALQQQQQQQQQQQPQGYIPTPAQLPRQQGNTAQLNQPQQNLQQPAPGGRTPQLNQPQQQQRSMSAGLQQAAAVGGQGSSAAGNQQYPNNSLPLDNLLDNNMPNSNFGTSDVLDLDLLENILKNKD